ncbi:hypothetical protein ACFPM0_18450 [Pseudonocardia sulfidoxydans]|uniref:hypothetical protein n=1 Tax=Pseudonocardia sulfidoxydans TaxID=54011 RepID=UPI00361E9C64
MGLRRQAARNLTAVRRPDHDREVAAGFRAWLRRTATPMREASERVPGVQEVVRYPEFGDGVVSTATGRSRPMPSARRTSSSRSRFERRPGPVRTSTLWTTLSIEQVFD